MPRLMHTNSHDTEFHKVKCRETARSSSQAPTEPHLRLRTVDTRIWGVESAPTSPVECKQVLQVAVEEALKKLVIPRLYAVEQSLGIGRNEISRTSSSSEENIGNFPHLLSQYHTAQHRSSSLSHDCWSALQTEDDIETLRSEGMTAWHAAVPQLPESTDCQGTSDKSIASETLRRTCPSISSLRNALRTTTNLQRRQRLEELIDETQTAATMSNAMPVEVTSTADKRALRTKIEEARPQTYFHTSRLTLAEASHDTRSEGHDQSDTLFAISAHIEKVSESLHPASYERRDSEQLGLDSMRAVQPTRKASEENATNEASCERTGSDNGLPLNEERLETVMESLKDELNNHMTTLKGDLNAIPKSLEEQVFPAKSGKTLSFSDMKDSLPSSITKIFQPNRRKKENEQLEKLLLHLLHGVNDIKSTTGAIEHKQNQTLLSSPTISEVAELQGRNSTPNMAKRNSNHAGLATMIQNNDDQTLLHSLADTNFHASPPPRLESTNTRPPLKSDGVYAGLARPRGGRAMASSILTGSSTSTFNISVRRPKGARSMTDPPCMSSNIICHGL